MTVPPICVLYILHIQSGFEFVQSFKLSTDKGMFILHHQLLCVSDFEIIIMNSNAMYHCFALS